MVLEYKIDNNLGLLSPVFDEYGRWYTDILMNIFYSEKDNEEIVLPHSLGPWMKEVEKEGYYTHSFLNKLEEHKNDLHTVAQMLVDEVQRNDGKPEAVNFDSFHELYDGFITQLRRLERETSCSDYGVDSLTGLRNESAMWIEVERELERLSRQGQQFCLVLARIDNFDKIRALMSDTEYRAHMSEIAVLVRKCLRTFDDAYRVSDSEIVMSLKQTNMQGGSIAVERLRQLMIEAHLVVVENEKKYPLTMSYCISEPIPGDGIEEVVENMHEDLARYEDHSGASMEYNEVSPLARYVESLDAVE